VAKPRRLAHESGINRTYLSGVERSERNVSIDNIARIRAAPIASATRLQPASSFQEQELANRKSSLPKRHVSP
jgi:transcriptional regulator with XRE-family HTH domain